MVFKENTSECIASFKITTSQTAVKSIEFARRGNCLLINSADRLIRVYEEGEILACGQDGEPEPIQKLQDLVNKYVEYLWVYSIFCFTIVYQICSETLGKGLWVYW